MSKKKPAYSVAMSKDTGCIVMIRTDGKQVSVMGSLTREDSLNFVKSILEWSDETIKAQTRLAYAH
jgi:hypothetical protein